MRLKRRNSERSYIYLLAAFLTVAFIILSPNCIARAQNPTRATRYRLDLDPTWKLNKRWSADIELSSRFEPDGSGWRKFGGRPELQYGLRKWIDLTAGLNLIYTHQNTTSNTWETRPYVGVMLKMDIWRGINLSDYLRLEARFQKNLDTQDTTFAKRLRNRIRIQIPINSTKLSQVGTWSLIVDSESFYVRDTEIHEAFKGQQTFRFGVGWRRDKKWSYQFLYELQRSRNNVGQPFNEIDDVFRFRLIPTLTQ